MLIPVGLIMRGLQEVEDEEFRAAMRRQDMFSQAEMYEKRGQELFAACTGPDACLLVVADARDAHVTMDDIPVFHGATPAPQGFFAVCPGLHVLTTVVRDQPVGRALTLAPATAHFVRLDHEGASFVDLEPAAADEAAASVRARTAFLLDYNAVVARTRVHAGLARSNHEAHLAALPDLLEAFGNLARGATEKAWLYARRAQIMLTGAPISTFSRLLKLVADHDQRLRAAGRLDDAKAWIAMMSWVVPGLPPIEAAKAELGLTAK